MKMNESDLLIEGPVNVGQTYPLFGMITEIVSQEGNTLTAKINKNVTAIFQIEGEGAESLKRRAFEPGIFVAEVIKNDPVITVTVSTVVFRGGTKTMC